MIDNKLLLDIHLSADDYANKYHLDTGDVWWTSEQDVEEAVRKHIAQRAAEPPTAPLVGTNCLFRTCGRCAASIDIKMAVYKDHFPYPTKYCPNCGAKFEGGVPFETDD